TSFCLIKRRHTLEAKSNHKEMRRREIEGVIFALSALVLCASLLSFDAHDSERLRMGHPVANLVGPFGAWLASHLRGMLGLSSFFVPLGFGVASWTMLRHGSIRSIGERLVALGYLMIVTSPLFTFLLTLRSKEQAGGWMGELLFGFLQQAFGLFGAMLFLVAFNVVGYILLGIFSIMGLLEGVKKTRSPIGKIIDSATNIFARIKKRRVPLNKLEKEIRRRGKLPWIVKKRMVVYEHQCTHTHPLKETPLKLIPLQNPVYDGMAGEGYALHDYRDATDSLFNSLAVAQKEEMGESVLLLEQAHVHENCASTSLVGDRSLNCNLETAAIRTSSFLSGEDDAQSEAEFSESELIRSKELMRKDELEIAEEESDEEVIVMGASKNTAREVESQTIPHVFNDIVIEKGYGFPARYLLSSQNSDSETFQSEIRRNSELLVNTLRDFGIESRVVKVNRGPVITLYEMQIAPGIKVNRIVSLADDIAMALAASRVRVVAPIPGKSAVGIEVPNLNREIVTLGDIIKLPEYSLIPGKLKVALGKDILGNPVTLDIKKLPHLLIAGATGSGKSVLVNTIITSLIYSYDPNHVRFILVDPKMVELQLYNGLPHLLTPVITEPHVAPRALKWATLEMERRYRLLAAMNTRDIDRYNEHAERMPGCEKLPYIVIIMDELADLMMVAAKEIEGFITRIAQKARAVGIHLVLATQRPSVDVITGIIKANFPARIAFQVAQKTDSRTIIDQNGAEKLLGKGDMLYQSPMSSFPIRIQGAYISEDEIMTIVNHLRKLAYPQYIDIEEEIFQAEEEGDFEEEDELFQEALRIVAETKKASASYLQRRLSIGYNRAARMIELMEEKGYVGPQQGSKPREVYL
ncbi:MAG: DNA translocase FtsK, partial [Spirochaetes bacterium]|nr:DNA translocase FtsK [Spirochaetota bacterium]